MRASILDDVSSMLNCNAQDLQFLFQTEMDKSAGKIYKLDLPDYRAVKPSIYLEAAE